MIWDRPVCFFFSGPLLIISNGGDGSPIFGTDIQYICSRNKNLTVKVLFITSNGIYSS